MQVSFIADIERRQKEGQEERSVEKRMYWGRHMCLMQGGNITRAMEEG